MRNASNTLVRLDPVQATLPGGSMSALTLYWLAFSVSIVAFVTDFALAGRFPTIGVLLHVLGLVPCGFAWLFSRALFRPTDRPEHWPGLIVGALFVSCLVRYLAGPAPAGGWLGYVGGVQALIGSAMLLMTFVEAIDGKASARAERRFRTIYATCYSVIVGLSIVAGLPELAAWQATVQATLASVALVAAAAAYRYRLRNPLADAAPAKGKASPVVPRPQLAERMQRLLHDERVFLDPDFKVADLASMLELPDYRVSQCIVNDLGFKNFNQMINTYRVTTAKELLAAHDNAATPVLVIAMDCGFASLGPFNRAFKAQTGMTPTQYRRRVVSESAGAGAA
ncbi:MAG: AraC family transcriptional regulator [Pseudomonadota bacterium]